MSISQSPIFAFSGSASHSVEQLLSKPAADYRGFFADGRSTVTLLQDFRTVSWQNVRRVFQLLNDMVREGEVVNYAIGGAIAAVFYVEPFA